MKSRASYLFLGFVWATVLAVVPTGNVQAQEPVPPFIAVSTGTNVNVRAGQSANFERVCQLDKGEEVYVAGKEFSWYKIQLPPKAKSYVSKQYVQYLGANAGGIAAADVNVRAGAGVHHTVVGQLSKGEQIFIQEELEDWYRIEPVADSFGWVSEEYLKFKSKNISGFPMPPERKFLQEDLAANGIGAEPYEEPAAPVPPPEKDIFIKTHKIMIGDEQADKPSDEDTGWKQDDTPKLRKLPPKPKKADKGMLTFAGSVERYENAGSDGVHFKIMVNGAPVCYVQGVNHMLDRFVHQEVSVEGTVNQRLESRYSHPVINLVKVRLIL